jgi:hypothetical protein
MNPYTDGKILDQVLDEQEAILDRMDIEDVPDVPDPHVSKK